MRAPGPAPAADYDRDFLAWAKGQARAVREGRWDELDVPNLVEELESLGRTERHRLVSHLTVLLLHLLKRRYQPERRTRSWDLSIAEHVRRVHRDLGESPSLRASWDDDVAAAYHLALPRAARETKQPLGTFPLTITDAVRADLDAALAADD
jgi:hypothetical protein